LSVPADHPATRQVAAQSHPGLLVLKRAVNPKTGKLMTVLSVDEVRRLADFFGMTSGAGGWRVAIIDTADDMNDNAANALLKMLEEPPGNAMLLVLSNTPSDPVDTSHLVMPPEFIAAQDRAKAKGFRDQDFWNRFLSYFAGDARRISPQTRKEYYDFYRRVPEKNLIALIARIGDGKQAAVEMAKVTAPTFLIWGTGDPLLPESALNAITRYLANAKISKVMMGDVGHYPPLEVPDRYAQLLAAYIEAGVPASALKQ